MATSNATEGLRGPGELVKKATGWFIAIGVLFIMLGIFAIAEPFAAGAGGDRVLDRGIVFSDAHDPGREHADAAAFGSDLGGRCTGDFGVFPAKEHACRVVVAD